MNNELFANRNLPIDKELFDISICMLHTLSVERFLFSEDERIRILAKIYIEQGRDKALLTIFEDLLRISEAFHNQFSQLLDQVRINGEGIMAPSIFLKSDPTAQSIVTPCANGDKDDL